MTVDLIIRAETPAALAYFLKRPMANRLPIVFPLDEVGAEVSDPDLWEKDGALGTDISYHYIKQNRLVVSKNPAQFDPACWLMVRIIRDVASADHEEDPTGSTDPQPDRWRQSRLKRAIKEAGSRADWNGIRAWQIQFPNGGGVPTPVRRKKIQIIRGSELAALHIFPEFAGGSAF